MARLFGTDGARGIAVTELTCELAMQIGRAAALVLTRELNHKPRLFIGKDTRISSDVLEMALAAGICSVGADAHLLGVVPTPAVAMLVRKYHGDAGVMISASHNSVEFNGIKLFSGEGFKLSDSLEEEIEALILDHPGEITLKEGTELGRVYQDTISAETDYIQSIQQAGGDLSGLRVAVDCANGSASATAEKILTGLGAECVMLSASPDGTNINEKCGSTHMERLIEYVKTHPCHAGVAFDGDADRCLAVDEKGTLLDGDQIIAICAADMKRRGQLDQNTAVVTVMSNLGFLKFCKENGIQSAITKVGDRYVLEKMLEGGYAIGGEQSGHVIFLKDATTGDGQLTAVKLLSILKSTGQPLSELAKVMEMYPQVLVNVKIEARHKGQWEAQEEITGLIASLEQRLGGEGRILVRESGTEPLIRIMAEGRELEMIQTCAEEIARKIQETLC